MMASKISIFSALRALSRPTRQAQRFAALPSRRPPPLQPLIFPRYNSTTSPSENRPLTDRPNSTDPNAQLQHPHVERLQRPEYHLTFTCKPCSTRSSHYVSKQGYHKGSVLITCPDCKNRHVISDHLGIFSDKSLTIEDLMREKGQIVKKGTLSEDGSLEFWADGEVTEHVGEKRVKEETKGLE